MSLVTSVHEPESDTRSGDRLPSRFWIDEPPTQAPAGGRQARQSRLSTVGLPLPLSSFIGRTSELGEIEQLLAAERLVTLTGPGGCGKTRLALETASRIRDSFADGTVFVSLAPVDAPGLVAATVARTLGIRDGLDRSACETVAEALSDRELLLVLDNFEHLLDAVGLVSAWLAACPRLTILATSRERLRLQGEHVYAVPPLSLTDADHPDPADSEAVHLFVARARALDPCFAPTDATTPIVAELCRRLDGLPLAIELAAARSRLLSPAAMLSRLDRAPTGSPLELLAGGARDLPLRQQTLRRTIAWSHALLSEPERQLFRQLAVFVGGFTLEAVEAITFSNAGAGEPHRPSPSPRTRAVVPAPLELLVSLLERSLLRRVDTISGEPRFEMLATIREFACEQLDLSQERPVLQTRHGRYYHDLAEEIAPRLHGPNQANWLDVLDAEHGNLRAAMAWSAEHDLRLALGLGGALWRFWQVRGHVSGSRAWLEQVVAAHTERPTATSTPSRARTLNALAFLAFMAGDYEQAADRHRETLAIRRAIGDEEGVVESLNNLGLVLRCMGEHTAADELFEEALMLSRALGNRAREANILNNLARSAYYQRQFADARSRHEQALAVGREAGDAWVVAICLGDLGDVYQAQGTTETARQLYEESLAAWRALGDLRGVAQSLEGLAGLLVAERPEQAVRLFAACGAVRAAIGEPCSLVRRSQIEETLTRARAALGPERFTACWSDGRSLSADQAVELVLAPSAPDPAAIRDPSDGASTGIGWGPLTRREIDVARLVIEGHSNRQIAATLVVSERTVGTHLDHIYAKLGVSSRTAVAHYAFRQGLG